MDRVGIELGTLLEEGRGSSDQKVARFCEKVLSLQASLFLFASKKGVEPTNNRAERALRSAVIWRKLSFGTWSPEGSRFVERMLTVVATCRRQKRNVLSYLQAVCEAQDLKQPAPSLLGGHARARPAA
jgi:transposase